MKSKSMIQTKTDANEDPTIRLIKTANCPSLSDKSKLSYQIGCKEKSDVWFRITHNSGTGSFCDRWVSLREIEELFRKNPRGQAMTAWVLSPLFRGKSQNSPFFLFAALKNEGLVQPSKDVRRCYDAVDPKDFLAKVQTWVDKKPGGQNKDAEKKPKAKPASMKKKATTKKKKNSPS